MAKKITDPVEREIAKRQRRISKLLDDIAAVKREANAKTDVLNGRIDAERKILAALKSRNS